MPASNAAGFAWRNVLITFTGCAMRARSGGALASLLRDRESRRDELCEHANSAYRREARLRLICNVLTEDR